MWYMYVGVGALGLQMAVFFSGTRDWDDDTIWLLPIFFEVPCTLACEPFSLQSNKSTGLT